jgi:DNA-binding LacI/PurR family transcriptional regulator
LGNEGSENPQKPTIQDVARLANVGVGTVSRVINNQANVSEATRQRVKATIEALGYKPDQAARALRHGKTGSVGVLVPLFTRHFYVEILRSIVRATSDAGMSLIVFDIERMEDLDTAINRVAARGLVDGLFAVSIVPSDSQIQTILSSELRLVLIDAFHPQVSSVEIDHSFGAYLAVSYLITLGHKRIGLIGRPDDPFAEGFGPRKEGYIRALTEAGFPIDNELLVAGEYSRESGTRCMEQLLSLRNRPSAVFAGSDLQALGAIEAIHNAGLRVPEDIAVIGYNDVELAEYVGLTTVRLPLSQVSATATARLSEELSDNSAETRHTCLGGELIIRRTSGKPKNQ